MRQLVVEIDATYSKCFPTKDGNVRGFCTWMARGETYRGSLASFRRETRGELLIQWGLLSSEQFIFMIGKLGILIEFMISFSRFLRII